MYFYLFTGCGLDFHKRCALQLPSNCNRARRQVSTSFSLFPPRRPRTHSLSNQAGGSLEEVRNCCNADKCVCNPGFVCFSNTPVTFTGLIKSHIHTIEFFQFKLISFTLHLSPDQQVQARIQASILGRGSGVAGSRVQRLEQGSGPSHLPHPQLHQTHRVPVLPPAAQRPLQAGAAVLRWEGVHEKLSTPHVSVTCSTSFSSNNLNYSCPVWLYQFLTFLWEKLRLTSFAALFQFTEVCSDSFMHRSVDLLLCLWSLSCYMIQLCVSFICQTDGIIVASRILWYTLVLIVELVTATCLFSSERGFVHLVSAKDIVPEVWWFVHMELSKHHLCSSVLIREKRLSLQTSHTPSVFF